MMMEKLTFLTLGAIAMANATIAVFFLRFWKAGRDRFFLFFALAFLVEAVNRVALALSDHPNEGSPWHYGVRLLAYGLILVAIWEKNRSDRRPR